MEVKNKARLSYIVLVFSLLIGGFLRFFKLNWGDGYFFHPDEYHIVAAVERLIENGVTSNPKLFSYGSLTVYLIYFARQALVLFQLPPQNIFLIGRFLAALFSTITLVNIFILARMTFKEKNLIPAAITLTGAFVPGLIQQAHFLTPESFMTFWITLSSVFIIKYFLEQKTLYLFLCAVSIGLAGGTKISSFAIAPFYLLTLATVNIKKEGFFKNLKKCIAFLFVSFVFFFLSFPYSILDYNNFKSTTLYESSLSMGATDVFYTRSFAGSTPLIFQLNKIYPYTLGPLLLVFSLLGIILAVIKIYREKNKEVLVFVILLGSFLSYFVFNSFLFTKWTRFIHPTIPFLIIFAFVGANEIIKYLKYLKLPLFRKYIEPTVLTILIVPTFIWGLMFFQIYTKNDVRLDASEWFTNNVDVNKFIVTETGNTLEIPLNGRYAGIAFDFYNVDNNPILLQNLLTNLYRSDYFIIQSRRIFYNHMDKNKFPIVYNFYNALFSGKLGFEEVKTFSSFPYLKIGTWKTEINDESAEETWSVFDHPVIRIYKKTIPYPISYYEKLLRQ